MEFAVLGFAVVLYLAISFVLEGCYDDSGDLA